MPILLVAIILVIFLIFMIASNKTKNKFIHIKDQAIPDNLGIQTDTLLPIVQELDRTLSSSYTSNVKARFLKEHPKVRDYEFDWFLFELKRFFIMNSLLKSVPMFSPRVDDIWHEMLMFTREYEKFSKDYYKEVLHHTPNMEVTPIPGERGFFDWVYLSIFESTPNSRAIWGGFLKNPIKQEIIDDFKSLSENELLNKYFRQGHDWLNNKLELIRKFKSEILLSEQMMETNRKPTPLSHSSSESQIFHLAVGAAIFYSLYDSHSFQNSMDEILPDEYYKVATTTGTGATCSGFSCSGSSDSCHSGGDSGGDSGGSSCSSCGSGCSS